MSILRDWWSFPGFYCEGDEGGNGGGAGGSDSAGAEGGAGNEGGEGQGQEPKTYDEAYVKQLRAEAAANRKRASEAEARLKSIDDEKLSETERLKKEADEAKSLAQQAQERTRAKLGRAEVLVAASKAKIVDPDAAYKLVRDELEFNDEGEPTNAGALIEKLAKDKPYLVEAAGGGGSSPANPGGGRGGAGAKLDPKNPAPWRSVFKS